jgi:hypothetical protein
MGFYGCLARVDLRYEEPMTERSLVAKFSLADEDARLALAEIGVYGREYRFYTSDLAALSPIRVPQCYFAHFEPKHQQTCLLLELVPGVVADEVAGASYEQADLVCREAGRFHAFWRGHPALRRNEWLQSFGTGKFAENFASATQSAAADGCKALSKIAPDWLLSRGPKAGYILGEQLRSLGELPETLIHLDYRLPNFVFDKSGFALIDWQSVLIGPGVVDLGFFLFCSLTVENRRAWQEQLVATYSEASSIEGSGNLTLALQRMALFAAFNTIRNAPVIDLSKPEVAALWGALTERAYAAVEDTGALDLI